MEARELLLSGARHVNWAISLAVFVLPAVCAFYHLSTKDMVGCRGSEQIQHIILTYKRFNLQTTLERRGICFSGIERLANVVTVVLFGLIYTRNRL